MKNLSLAIIKVAIPFILFSTQTPIAMAADSVKLDDDGLELTVTANRRPQDISKTLAAMTVITKDDIERYQATSVTEILNKVPGINITNNGGVGKVTSVFLRGTNSGQALVLIDGVRHGSATVGSTAFEHLPLDQIERIEVVRGPRSSLYGSEAIGGVIQIFTRKAYKGFKPSFEISAGSHDTLQGSVNFAGGNGKTWYNLNLQSEDTQGIDACNSTSSGCFADEPDKDGYHRDSISLNLGHSFNSAVKGEVSVLRAEGDTEFDGGFQDQGDFVQQVISSRLDAQVSDKVSLRFSVGQSRDESDNFKQGVYSSTFNTKRNTVSVLADIAVTKNHDLLFGTDWNDAKVNSNTNYDVTSRDNKGVFGSYSAQFNKTQFDASLRYDDNQQFGAKTTGGIALAQNISDALRLKASYGTAFKAPTFNQLYFPGFGSATLKPEQSKNFEIGVDGRFNKGNWELNVFQNEVENLIAGFPVGNINEARIRGVEANWSTKIGAFDFASNITLQKPESRSGANSGKLLLLRPERILNLNLDRQFGKFKLGTSIHAESKRFTNADNSAKLGGFTTVDLRAEYAFAKNWNIGLKVANLLDKDYATVEGFNQDGVNGLVSIKYAPK